MALALCFMFGGIGLEATPLPDLASPVMETEPESGGHLILGLMALFIGLVVCIAALILIGIGMVLGVVAVAIAGALIAVGAISTSVLVGFLSKSPASGLRTLFLFIGVAAGLPCGIAGTYLVIWLSSELALANVWMPLLGGVCGMAGGLLVALLFNLAWGRAAKAAARRLAEWRLPASNTAATQPGTKAPALQG